MNWRAWNSVRPNALANSPRDMPSSASSTAITTSSATEPGSRTPSQVSEIASTTPTWT
jgi:hypothetical protein